MGRQPEEHEGAPNQLVTIMSHPTEYLRENVLIRPLEWAYNSRALRGVRRRARTAPPTVLPTLMRAITLPMGHGRFTRAIQSRDAADACRPKAESRRRCQGGPGRCRRRLIFLSRHVFNCKAVMPFQTHETTKRKTRLGAWGETRVFLVSRKNERERREL